MIIYRQTKPHEYIGYDPKATLKYQNRKLRQTFMDLKEEAMTPLRKTTETCVEEMEALYWKIKECEDNQEEWIKCLQEVDNLKFLKRNVEHRLS
uniref:NADH dehydrogenase [ubiquinone] 1 beta subcomplex subunit 7 n=1 Tax=Panagrolaimus sp. ES5 TaxID=591445 RepID=A0AC34GJ34_9BILA